MNARSVALRHAATLASIGWYLMVPPVNHPWSRAIWHWFDTRIVITDKCNPDSPLSGWKQDGEFEKLAECQAKQEKEPDDTKEVWKAVDKFTGPSKDGQEMEEENIRCAYHARCIATDDPRPKGN
jgi:hypothetical protein